jgi:hypothetical protein
MVLSFVVSIIPYKAMEGLRPIFFGPCTLRRTWGTRPFP